MIRSNNTILLAITITIITAVCGYAQTAESPVSVRATVEPDRGYVGDRLIYSLIVEADTTIRIAGHPAGEKLGVFDVKNSSVQADDLGDGRARYSYLYEITAYETGTFWLPSSNLEVILPDGGVTEVLSDSLSVVVMSIAGRDSLTDIKGLKEPIAFGSQIPWLYIAIGAVLAAVVAWVLYRVFRKKDVEEAPEPVDTRPPWIIARERLEKLRESDYISRGEFKFYYQSLTDIMRKYIEPRYGIDATDRTTMELKRLLRNIHLDRENYDILFSMFDRADLVKFAKRVPGPGEVDEDFQKAWQFVQRTCNAQAAEVEAV